MKIINIGLSILVSLGLAISPIQASETDVADETNEESVVNSNEDVESNADEIKIRSISVRTEDDLTTYPLDENETKNIRLVVNKIYTDGHVEQTTDYQYYICAISNNLSISNATDTIQDNMMYSGTNNELSVTKTSRGNASFAVKVILDDFMDGCCLSFNDTKFVNITLNAGDGQFEDGTTTYTYPFKGNGSYQSPNVIAPKGYVFGGWYDENGNSVWEASYNQDTTFYARYLKLYKVTFDADVGHFENGQKTASAEFAENANPYYQEPIGPEGKMFTGWYDANGNSINGYALTEDTTFYARYSKAITITFDAKEGNFGDGEKKQVLKTGEGKSVYPDGVIAPEGMIFTGWHVGSADGYKVDPYSTCFDEDTTLYASYSKAIHINLNLDALNMESQSFEVAQGESVRLANIFHVDVDEDKEITGYRIDGTNTIIDKNQELVFDEDINLTAIVKKKIKLTYDSNGAGFDSVSEYYFHVNNVFNKTPERKYFAGWAANSPDGIVYTSATSGMPFTEDTTLYAVWKDGVTIHLDLGEGVDGSVQNGNVVKKGSLLKLYNVNVSQNPNGKKLAGWRVDENPKVLSTNDYFVLNKDITLHAVWEDTITVTIKDPETDDVLYTSKIAKGTSFQDWYVVNDYIPEGKSLLGWTLDKDKKNTIRLYHTHFDRDVTLYPVYADNIKITLDWGNDGGKGYINQLNTNTLERAKGSEIYFDYTILSTPKGKMLAGWKIGDTEDVISSYVFSSNTNSNYKLYKDTTLHAIWKDTVKITLNANGEKFANNQEIIEEEYIKNNSYYSYSPQYPWEQKNLDGTKVITGWRVGSPDGPIMSKKLYNEFDKDTTYYAVWGDLITITFKNKGIKVGEFDNSSTWSLKNIFRLMTSDSQLLSDFDDETFLGWYNTETGEKLTEDTVFTKDCVFEARTEKRPVKITLDYNGGSGKLNEVTTMGGYFGTYMLNDPYIEAPDDKVFVGWSLEKDGDVLEQDIFYLCYLDKDTTLYAKYEDEVTLTIHDNGNTYTQKVPVNVWMMYTFSSYCEIDGNKYYAGQPLKFTKDVDVYLKESSGSSSVRLTYRDISKLIGDGIGYALTHPFIKWVNFGSSITEDPGKEVNLELDESFIPKGMKFDKWETVGDITIKDPTSKKTSFIMPKNELGKTYEIYATYKPIVPLQFEKESIELNKSERSQLTVTGDYETLTWSSSDPTTVQVDQSGNIHAVKSGKATITVKDESGKKASCVVTVINKLKSLSLSEKNVELKGQTEKKLSVTLTPSDADEEKLTWTSSNEGVVKVSEDGTLTPVSCGEATITVESKSGLTDRCKVVVVVHDWKLESKVDATVDKEGKKVYRCTLCHETKEEVIPKLNGKWVTDSYGKWYQYSDGTFEKSGFKEIDGKTYYFQNDGYVKMGWLSFNNEWYMFNSDGVMITGWYGTYYFDKNGKMKTNAFTPDNYYVGSDGVYLRSQWFKHGGKDYYVDCYGHVVKNAWIGSYYLSSDGSMATNTFTVDGYYVGSNGAYLTNAWFKHDGKDYYVNGSGLVVKNAWQGAYYLGADGAMLKNQFTPDGYYVGETGAYLTNQKVTVSGKDYYLNAAGTLAKNQWSGDYYIDGNGNVSKDIWSGSYYLGSDGKYVKNQFTPDGYYCGADGVYVTNRWIVVDGKDYYMNASGKMTKDAWVGSYYLGSDGAMLTNTYTPDGYYVDENGLWTPSKWVQSGGNWLYRHSDGTYTTNDFEVIGSQTYYFDSNGYMVTGWKQLGSNWYYFNGSGIMVQNNWAGNYYFDGDGKMVRDRWIGNYYVGSDGCMLTNHWIGNYYVGSNGLMVTGWQCISGQWYYFDSNGIYQTGERYLGGEYYYFNAQGVMQTGTAEDGWEYNSSGQRMVYWSRRSTNPVYHRTPDNIRSYNLVRGTYSQAVAAGKTNRCKNC